MSALSRIATGIATRPGAMLMRCIAIRRQLEIRPKSHVLTVGDFASEQAQETFYSEPGIANCDAQDRRRLRSIGHARHVGQRDIA